MVGSKPEHAVGDKFFESGEDVAKEKWVKTVNDNSKLTTSQYRDMLYGICKVLVNQQPSS